MVDAYFKEHFWTFHLLVIFTGAFLTARTVNAFVQRAVAVPPERVVDLAPPSRGEDAPELDQVNLRAFLERNLLDAMREDLAAERRAQKSVQANAEQEKVVFNDGQCGASSVGVKLLATVVASVPEESVAVLTDTSKSEATAYREGDVVQDQATVHEISWRHVKLNRDGRCERLSLDDSRPSPPRPTVTKRRKEDDEEEDFGAGVQKTGDDEYVIERAEIDGVLSNLNKLATQARIVPSFHNGKANGFKLFSIRPNSLYSKIGIQNGDIVQRINGFEMNSPDKALEIYGKLKDAQNITVDLLRRGKSKTLSYNIR